MNQIERSKEHITVKKDHDATFMDPVQASQDQEKSSSPIELKNQTSNEKAQSSTRSNLNAYYENELMSVQPIL